MNMWRVQWFDSVAGVEKTVWCNTVKERNRVDEDASIDGFVTTVTWVADNTKFTPRLAVWTKSDIADELNSLDDGNPVITVDMITDRDAQGYVDQWFKLAANAFYDDRMGFEDRTDAEYYMQCRLAKRIVKRITK